MLYLYPWLQLSLPLFQAAVAKTLDCLCSLLDPARLWDVVSPTERVFRSRISEVPPLPTQIVAAIQSQMDRLQIQVASSGVEIHPHQTLPTEGHPLPNPPLLLVQRQNRPCSLTWQSQHIKHNVIELWRLSSLRKHKLNKVIVFACFANSVPSHWVG